MGEACVDGSSGAAGAGGAADGRTLMATRGWLVEAAAGAVDGRAGGALEVAAAAVEGRGVLVTPILDPVAASMGCGCDRCCCDC